MYVIMNVKSMPVIALREILKIISSAPNYLCPAAGLA
jgi:hypothetical protein